MGFLFIPLEIYHTKRLLETLNQGNPSLFLLRSSWDNTFVFIVEDPINGFIRF